MATSGNRLITRWAGVGADPQGIAINSAGTGLYVANDVSNTVSVIDAASNTETGTIPVGSGPFALAVADAPVPAPVVIGISPAVGSVGAGTCQQFDLRLNDGTDHTADFQFK